MLIICLFWVDLLMMHVGSEPGWGALWWELLSQGRARPAGVCCVPTGGVYTSDAAPVRGAQHSVYSPNSQV